MKTKTLMAALMLGTLAFGSLALADDDHGGRKGRKDHDERQAHDNRNGEKHRGGRDNDRDEQRGENGRRGAGPDHAFYRGSRLPVQYRERGYWVDDWRGHRLSAPPAGYHWVQTGGDYVLVANNTGIIFQIFLGP